MKLTPSEQTLLSLIQSVGGSYCASADAQISSEVRRAANRLERKGLLRIEETQDGPRFTATGDNNV